MNILEAHQITMDKIIELENFGIKVLRRKSKSATDLKNTKYDLPDRLPRDLYEHISFVPKTDKDWSRICQASFDLWEDHEISFDMGAGIGQRDWEIDWSFTGPDTKSSHVKDEGDTDCCVTSSNEVITTEYPPPKTPLNGLYKDEF